MGVRYIKMDSRKKKILTNDRSPKLNLHIHNSLGKIVQLAKRFIWKKRTQAYKSIQE